MGFLLTVTIALTFPTFELEGTRVALVIFHVKLLFGADYWVGCLAPAEVLWVKLQETLLWIQ